jgi:hypothetical protein
MQENILVDTKIMFLSQLSDKLWRKTEKNGNFWRFFSKKNFLEIFFKKTEKNIFNRPRVEYFGRRKSRYFKNTQT